MKRAFATLAVIALTAGSLPLSVAQTSAPPTNRSPLGSPNQEPAEKFDNSGGRNGPSIASDPDRAGTPAGTTATKPRGARGPVEGGTDAARAQPKAVAPQEGGGVQNPGLGS